MPRRSSSSESDRASNRKRRERRKRSSSPESENSRSRTKKTSRHTSRSRSRTPQRGSRGSVRKNKSRSKSPSTKRKSRRSRSSSRTRSSRQSRSRSGSKTRHRRNYKGRSRSGSRSDSRSSKNKKSRKHSKSISPSRSKHHSSKSSQLSDKDADPLKQKVLQAAKAAAIADAELREKGLLKEVVDAKSAVSSSISEQLQRAQAMDEINAPSFVQHRFSSSRTQTKTTSQKGTDEAFDRDAHMAAIFGLAAPKMGVNPVTVDASIKKLETWKENPEMLVHECLLVDQVGKQERWLKKLLVMRKKTLSEDP